MIATASTTIISAQSDVYIVDPARKPPIKAGCTYIDVTAINDSATDVLIQTTGKVFFDTIVQTAVGLEVKAGSDVTLRAMRIGGSLSIQTEKGAITQQGSIEVVGKTSLFSNAPRGRIHLTENNFMWGPVDVELASPNSDGGSVSLQNKCSTNITADIRGSFDLFVDGSLNFGRTHVRLGDFWCFAGRSITQTGELHILRHGHLTISENDASITLDHKTNFMARLTVDTCTLGANGGHVTICDGAITTKLIGGKVGGNLTIDASSGVYIEGTQVEGDMSIKAPKIRIGNPPPRVEGDTLLVEDA